MNNPDINSYSQFINQPNPQLYKGAEFFSSILWEIRKEIGASNSDNLIFDTLYRLSSSPDFVEFRDDMKAADLSGSYEAEIHNIFASIGIGNPVASDPPSGVYITNRSSNFGSPYIAWNSGSQFVDYYEVWRKKRRISDGYVYPDVLLGTTYQTTYYDGQAYFDQFSGYEYSYYIKSVNIFNKTSTASSLTQWVKLQTSNKAVASSIPDKYFLRNNYPNPFNPTTTIKFGLPQKSMVTLTLYNIVGQKVSILLNSELSAGSHEITFDAGRLSSGFYIAKMEAFGNSGEVFSKNIKMQLIK